MLNAAPRYINTHLTNAAMRNAREWKRDRECTQECCWRCRCRCRCLHTKDFMNCVKLWTMVGLPTPSAHNFLLITCNALAVCYTLYSVRFICVYCVSVVVVLLAIERWSHRHTTVMYACKWTSQWVSECVYVWVSTVRTSDTLFLLLLCGRMGFWYTFRQCDSTLSVCLSVCKSRSRERKREKNENENEKNPKS